MNQNPAPGVSRLREATRPSHEQVEGSTGLTRPDVMLADYITFLRAWRAVLAVAEPGILAQAHALPSDLAVGERCRKASLAARDLAELGARETAVPTELRVATPHRALGCLYVLEGSTLGAQVLLRDLRARLGLADRCTNLLRAYGDQVGPRWHSFVDILSRELDSGCAIEHAVIAAACDTFTAVDEAMIAARQL